VEIHANVIDNILHQDFLIRPNWAMIFDLVSIIIIGLLLGLVLPRLSASFAPVLGVGCWRSGPAETTSCSRTGCGSTSSTRS
jgi:CHASE2 domain-containing sensor protein